ncbi:hypothetical protein I3760_09G193200 [Carya illinoinensis]|nr:hypothetical protein I3760_09G193200 [Carya illinoinensis]
MSYEDFPEDKNAEFIQRTKEKCIQKQSCKRNIIRLEDSIPSDADQMIISVDDTLDDYLQSIRDIQNSNVQQVHGKKPRLSGRNFNIVTMTSSQETSVYSNVNIVGGNPEESAESNILFNSSATQILQNVPVEANFLPNVPPCKHCKAKRFFHETNSFCCADGSISLATNDVPDQLYNLFVSNTVESIQFQTYVRTYNNKFAFTSFGVKFDRNLCQRNRGIYTFRAQGQIYHYLPNLVPSDGQPSNLQLYFYDTEHEFENRIVDSIRMNPSIIAQLMDILRVNPYSTFFRSIGDLPNLEYQKIYIKSNPGLDQRVFNAPTSSEVAAIWVENDDSEHSTPRDIFVFNHIGGSHLVQYYFGCYDPLQYPLLFPFGDIGWHQGIQIINKRSASVSTNNSTAELLNPHQSTSAEQLLRREQQVLNRKRKDPTVSCREYYCYKLQIRENLKSILLISGRLLQQFVVDMYVKIETSRLDYFRCNQQHIRSELYQGIVDSIDLGETNASRIGKRIILPSSFIGGPRDMKKRYMEAMTLVQRYGKPDIFLTMTCNPNWKEISNELQPHEETQNRPDLIARVFKAKLEDLKYQLFKREIFGKISAYNLLMRSYLLNYLTKTTTYIFIQLRSNNGRTARIRGHDLDNRWVVPYNPYLVAMFDCHINVEICSTIKAVKYLYKYIYKGHDRVAFNLVPEQSIHQIDEIERFQSARWIAPPEAMWRIFGFIVNEVHPAVYSLHLHLENQHQVTFRAHENLTNVMNSDLSAKSMLTEFFATNQVDQNARKLLYREFPEFYVWSQQYKMWTVRKKQIVIGRIVTANPFEGERYYLRILLNHIRGPLSFQHLKTVNGISAPTFREAATMYGLLERDNSLEECLYEASFYQMSFSLRRLFATILVYCNPTNPRDLWERFERDMSADFQLIGCSSSNVRTETLHSISTILESMGKDINSFHLIDQNIDFDEDGFLSREIDDELAIPIPEEDLHASTLLNSEQQNAYNSILQKVLSNQAAAFFIDGPGGTGKTFLYKALLATIRKKQLIALATASSGVAASILPGGRTAHSRFKIPLNVDKNSTCSVSKQSGLARLLQTAKLIIWDEAPMSKKKSIEALDKMLKDINDSELSFGGKVIVFGGDFRQILPVIPTAMLIPHENDAASLDRLIDAVFHDISDYSTNISNMMNRAILTPKNNYVEEINTLLIQRFPGELKQYYSFDESIDASEQAIMEDFLHTLTPNGLPPYELLLKENCPIMLLRNINPSEGLCNGTRLICRNFDRNVIHAEIAVGHHSGKKVFIPRIPFLPSPDENSGFPFKRTQFPVKLSFAMSINKSQGQTLDFVGIYLPHPVFSHGQLYVALSRAKTISAVKILIRPISTDQPEKNYTKNIVYTEVLTLASSN